MWNNLFHRRSGNKFELVTTNMIKEQKAAFAQESLFQLNLALFHIANHTVSLED
jgi:hypothetical protein